MTNFRIARPIRPRPLMATLMLITPSLYLFSVRFGDIRDRLRLARFLCLVARYRIQRQSGMRVGAAGTHLGGDPDGFHDLPGRRSPLEGRAGMPANAIRALCD